MHSNDLLECPYCFVKYNNGLTKFDNLGKCNSCYRLVAIGEGYNYFELFGFDISFHIDINLLEERLLLKMKQLHPDKITQVNVSNKSQYSSLELKSAIENSALYNAAYSTLKSPIKRIEYILKLYDYSNNKQDLINKLSYQNLLMEALSWREKLDLANTVIDCQKIKSEFSQLANNLIANIGRELDESNKDKAFEGYIELQFINRFIDEIITKEAQLQI